MRAAFSWNKWREECYRIKLSGKKLYATVVEGCYKVTADGSDLFEELGSAQEEADTRRCVLLALAVKSFVIKCGPKKNCADYRPEQGALKPRILSSAMV